MKRPAHILVVDDNRSNRLIIERGLTGRGYEVSEATDGFEALQMLSATLELAADEDAPPGSIDLVVLDIMMPEMDGGQVLREIRRSRSRSGLPVIMATAMDTTDDIVEALAAGANDYVTKPISLPILQARVETQLELSETHRSLKGAHRSLVRSAKMETAGLLAAGVAHEIRNPLARIKMGLSSLERNEKVTSDEKLVELVGIMKSSLDKADEVVKGLMNVARDARLELKSEDVNAVVTESLNMILSDLEGSKVMVVTEFDPELPEALLAGPELIQVLLNLFDNSLHAMGDQGGTLTVRTSLKEVERVPDAEGSRSGNRIRQGDKAVWIEVLDTGPGLPEDSDGRLFDPFFTTKPTGAGVGMGLSVAEKIIELHGGLLTVADRDDTPGVRASIVLRKAGAFMTLA